MDDKHEQGKQGTRRRRNPTPVHTSLGWVLLPMLPLVGRYLEWPSWLRAVRLSMLAVLACCLLAAAQDPVLPRTVPEASDYTRTSTQAEVLACPEGLRELPSASS